MTYIRGYKKKIYINIYFTEISAEYHLYFFDTKLTTQYF